MGFLKNRTKGNITYTLLGTGEMAQGLKALAALPRIGVLFPAST